MRYIKYVLVAINLTFLFTSILFISVGGITYSNYGYFSSFLDKHFMLTPIFLMIVGSAMLICATSGLIGTLTGNVISTYIYYLLSFVFVLEILTAIGGFVLQGQVREMLIRRMNESIADYTNYETVAFEVDFVQRLFECCGIYGPSDWEGILPAFEDSETINVLVPNSCCGEFRELLCDEYFLSGCLDQLHYFVGSKITIFAIGARIAAGVHILIISIFLLGFFYKKFVKRTTLST